MNKTSYQIGVDDFYCCCLLLLETWTDLSPIIFTADESFGQKIVKNALFDFLLSEQQQKTQRCPLSYHVWEEKQ